jgi:hypothetical protein
MSESNSIVAVYETCADGEAGIRELQQAACNLKMLSILGKAEQSESEGINLTQSDRAASLCGDLCESVGEAAFFAIPDVGSLIVAGPLTPTVLAVLEGASADALSPLGSILGNAGIPEACIAHYESELTADKFLLIARGTPADVMHAKDILHITRPAEISIYFDVEKSLTYPVANERKPRSVSEARLSESRVAHTLQSVTEPQP